MRVLITGGSGFLGSHLAERLVADGHEVTLYDNFATGVPSDVAGLGEDARLVAGDVLDLSHLLRVAREHLIDHVVHGAAIVGAPASIARPHLTAKVNIEGALNVLEVARFVEARRIVDLSSEEIYGDFAAEIIDEGHPVRAVSVYGITKQATEQLAGHYVAHYGLPYVAARLSWVYGPRFRRERIPTTWMRDAVESRPTHVPRGGDHRIDLTYVDDAVDGLVRLLTAPELAHRAYHLATGVAPTLREVVAEIARHVPDWVHEVGPGLLEQSKGYVMPVKGALDIARARAELAYDPKHDLAAGVAATIAWLRDDGASA